MDVERNLVATDDAKVKNKTSNAAPPMSKEETIEHGEQDLLHEENVDTVLTAKMALVNDVSPVDYLWPFPPTQKRADQTTLLSLRPSMKLDSPNTTGNFSA